MLLCVSWLARIFAIYLIILSWICSFQLALATPATSDKSNLPAHMSNDAISGLVCSPFGICEPCPEDALKEPFCQPFGNRRLMHCVNSTNSQPSSQDSSKEELPSPHNALGPPNHTQHPQGETLAWESCGRIVRQERADFYEFVACNVIFAIIALFILFARSKRLNAMHARQLAARIGIIRNNGGGGRR